MSEIIHFFSKLLLVHVIAILGNLRLLVFFFEKNTYCCRTRRLPVCLSVCPSVVCRNIFCHGNLISNRPINPKIGLNVGYEVLHVLSYVCKGVIFRNSNCKLQIYATCDFFANRFVCTILTNYFLFGHPFNLNVTLISFCNTYQ